MKSKTSYEVGFGKPPLSTRFQKGQSGNPKGRPKGTKNVSSILEQELRKCITVTIRGRKKRMNALEAAIAQLIEQAATGDLAAVKLLFGALRMTELGTSGPEPEEQVTREEDLKIVAGILNRLRRATERDRK